MAPWGGRRLEGGEAMSALACEQVVQLTGWLDVRHTAQIREQLHAAVANGSGLLVVDLSGVEAVDAAGLGVLLGTRRLAERAGRQMVLRNTPPRLSRLLRATRLERVLRSESVQ